jgi:hypothetical protein
MSVFQFCNEDAFLQMSNNNPGSNLPGNSGIPNSNGGNPSGLPGGNNNPTPFGTYNTNTTIIHNDDSWSNTVRSIFIYGTGAIRFHLVRNGPPSPRILIIGGTLAVDTIGRIVQNSINDPNFILANIENIRTI